MSEINSRLYELSEIVDKKFSHGELLPDNIVNEIRTITCNGGYIGMAQIDPSAGNLEFNAKKIAKYIKYSEKIGLDMVIFPELALMGYPIEDTIDRHPLIVRENIKWLKGLAKITKNTTAVVGFVEPREKDAEGKRFYNSVAILQNGKITGIVRKSLLPTYSEFNDYRYIEPSPVVGVQPDDTLGKFSKNSIKPSNKYLEINGTKYGISICEDCWNNKDFFEKNLYDKDPIEELKDADIFINCSASPTRAKKEQLKHNMLSFISSKYKKPIVYVNQVGAIDNISFDGSSRVFNSHGELIARAKSFEEQFLIVNPQKNIGKIYPLTKGLEKSLTEQKVFTLEYESDLERTYKTIVQGIRDYFSKCGFKRAVLGLSGGLDSTVCAVLLADALGKENVFGISMPSKLTSKESKTDAEKLAHNLGIKDQLFVFGVDDMETTIDYIKKGYIDASIVTSFYQYGYDSLYMLYQYKTENKVPSSVNQPVELLVVNKENADTYMEELISLASIILVVLIHEFINTRLIDKYDSAFSIYDEMSRFYDNQNQAHESLRNYLYTNESYIYDEYEGYVEKAKENLEHITVRLENQENLWRFQLLENMVNNYEKNVTMIQVVMQVKNEEYDEYYNRLTEINNAIIKTSDEYFRLLTDELAEVRSDIDRERSILQGISWVIVLFCLIMISWLTYSIFRSITRPINEIVQNINEIKSGNYNLQKIASVNDEMNILCIALQDMALTVKKNQENEKRQTELERKLLIKENESLRKDEILASSELRSLQNQLNPHFLFNTFNMIYQKALEENSKSTIEMIEKMTECMRYTLSNRSRTTTLDMEINFIRNYLFIQSKRFEDRIQFEFNVEKNVPDIKIPSMIIEPLIDNAIRHGLSDMESGGEISVNITFADDHVYIRVEDNGKGMDVDEVEKLILNNFEKDDEKYEDSYGLYNLARRLKMYFGDEAAINISSMPECGFDALIILPASMS